MPRPTLNRATAAPRTPTPKQKRVLHLYVSGLTPRSVRALATIKRLCEQHFPGAYTLDVIDVYQRPEMVRRDQVLAVPTLIVKSPLPLRRLIGDMANEARVLSALGIHEPA